MIPMGFCQCGCGGRTGVADYTNPRIGWVVGRPLRFLAGHNNKLKNRDWVARFWGNVKKVDGCWLWRGSVSKRTGYGKMAVSGKTELAHRLAYKIQIGPIPDGKQVCHHCDVKLCVRGDHLFPGTQQDNMDDAVKKGRRAYGTKNVNARLNDEAVRKIRLEYTGQFGQIASFARAFGVSKPTISAVLRGKTWPQISCIV